MEALEKIYLSNYSSGVTYNWHDERLAVKDIEYIRTDAFIKKAIFYIQQHWIWNTKMIDGFKNYVKGE